MPMSTRSALRLRPAVVAGALIMALLLAIRPAQAAGDTNGAIDVFMRP